MFPIRKINKKRCLAKFRNIPPYRTIAERNAANARYIKLPCNEIPISIFSPASSSYRRTSENSPERRDNSAAVIEIDSPEKNNETRIEIASSNTSASSVELNRTVIDPFKELIRTVQSEIARCLRISSLISVQGSHLRSVKMRLQEVNRQEEERMLRELYGRKGHPSGTRTTQMIRTPLSGKFGTVFLNAPKATHFSNTESCAPSFRESLNQKSLTIDLLRTSKGQKTKSLVSSSQDLRRTANRKKAKYDENMDLDDDDELFNCFVKGLNMEMQLPGKIRNIPSSSSTIASLSRKRNAIENNETKSLVSSSQDLFPAPERKKIKHDENIKSIFIHSDDNDDFFNCFLKSLDTEIELLMKKGDIPSSSSTISSLSRKRNAIENNEKKNQSTHTYDNCFKKNLNLRLSSVVNEDFSPNQSKIYGKRTRKAVEIIDLTLDFKQSKIPRQEPAEDEIIVLSD